MKRAAILAGALLLLTAGTSEAGELPHEEYLKAQSIVSGLFMEIYNEQGADMRRAELIGACGFDDDAMAIRRRNASASKALLMRLLPERAKAAGITHAGTMLAHSAAMSMATGYELGYKEAATSFLRDVPDREAQCAALKRSVR